MDKPIESSLRPLQDRVLVALDDEDVETDSGIYLPEGVSEGGGNGATGTIVATGNGYADGKSAPPMEVEVGDRVLFGENFGRDLPDDTGNEYRLIRQSNLLATLGE